MATPARTVSKSLGKSFKNTLDLPFKLKWPQVSQDTAADILSELSRALNGVKFTSKDKKQRRGKKRKGEEGYETGCQPKRQRIDKGEDKIQPEPLASPPKIPPSLNPLPEELVAKRSQIVIGVNQVTRGLEKGTLRVAVVCLSVRLPLLHSHLQVLAATRNTPCIAINGVSAAVAPVLGLKRAMAIGFKKLSSDEVDYFSKLADLISSRAPKINIPWLQASASATVSTDPKGKLMLENVKEGKKTCTTEPEETVNHAEEEKDLKPLFPYLPLAIKKTIITPKKMKR